MINKYVYFYLIKQKVTKIIKIKQINYIIINNNIADKDYLYFLKKLFINSVLIKKNHNLEYFLYSINHFESKPINIICKNWLLLLYFSNISKFYTKFNINWHFIDVNDVLNYEIFNKTWKIFYKKRFVLILSAKRATFYNWFIQLTQFKNSKILIRLIQNYFVKLHLKKHRRGFYNVRSLFNLWFNIYSKENMIKGFSFFFKGKLGKKGSVKKKKFFVKQGKISLTNKNLRTNYNNYIIWTITGVVGCSINLYY